jgi:hypothetical protein
MPSGPWPVEISLCLSENDWRRVVGKYWESEGGEMSPWPQGQHASVEPFTYKDGALWLVVVFSRDVLAHPVAHRVGLIAHEATHLWQYVREHCGVLQADHEIEAHAVQWYSTWLYESLHAAGWLNPKKGKR